jgi:hypothetical protein
MRIGVGCAVMPPLLSRRIAEFVAASRAIAGRDDGKCSDLTNHFEQPLQGFARAFQLVSVRTTVMGLE